MYATPAQLTELFGEQETILLSTHGSGDTVDTAALEQAIAYASSEVDSYLAGRCAVPLTGDIPPVVMMVTGDIVRYRLTGSDVSEKDPILTRYKAAVDWLKQVASGAVSLPCAGAAPEDAGGVDISAGERTWLWPA